MAVPQIKIVIPGEPKAKGRPRFSCRSQKVYTPKETVDYENLIKLEYQAQCGSFRFPDDAMLDMRVLACYGIPQSKSKRQKELMLHGVVRPTKKPDLDNILKAAADSLNQIAYRDDTQIVDCQVRKFYSSEPRLEIIIRQIENDL